MIIKNKISIFFCFTDDSVEIFSFILLCHKERVKKAVSTLQLYGKMSLTNYITQSVVEIYERDRSRKCKYQRNTV